MVVRYGFDCGASQLQVANVSVTAFRQPLPPPLIFRLQLRSALKRPLGLGYRLSVEVSSPLDARAVVLRR
jgi:hypothetical protein